MLVSCGKSDTEREKERIMKEAAELKAKIDSAQVRIDSGKKELDSLMYRIKKDSVSIDSLVKKLTPFRK